MTISIESFGRDGTQQVDLIRITNASGSNIALIPVGARLVEAHFPDRHGHFADVVLGFDTVADYFDKHTYAGSIAGRFANRIVAARFELDGTTVELEANEGRNHLHGGYDGLDRQGWVYTVDDQLNIVTFTHQSPDGHGGYPGALDIEVTYQLDDDDIMRIDMSATSNAPTIINLVQHSYWNLSGHASGSVFDQQLMLNAATYVPVDDELLATGEVRLVEGTAFDFRRSRAIGERMHEAPTSGQYDHNWVLDGPRHELHLAAVAVDPATGRRLTLSTTEPGIQMYAGGYLAGLPGKGGATYESGAGFTLETQTFPCAPNIPYFPSARLARGEQYRHSMVFAFDCVAARDW